MSVFITVSLAPVRKPLTVACRGLLVPGATAWLDSPLPNPSIEQWRMVVIVTGYTMFVTSQYDVISTFANQRFGKVCWHNTHIKGRRGSGRAGRALKKLRKTENLKKQKKSLQIMFFFCSSTMLTSKIITEIIENCSEFSGCPNSCNEFYSSRSWKTIKLPTILLCERHIRPRCPPFERAEGQCPRYASILLRPCAYYSTRTLYSL